MHHGFKLLSKSGCYGQNNKYYQQMKSFFANCYKMPSIVIRMPFNETTTIISTRYNL